MNPLTIYVRINQNQPIYQGMSLPMAADNIQVDNALCLHNNTCIHVLHMNNTISHDSDDPIFLVILDVHCGVITNQ